MDSSKKPRHNVTEFFGADGLITRSISGEQQLLPIWHNITKKEVVDHSPSLADKVARNTAINTVEEIADEIAEVIQNS